MLMNFFGKWGACLMKGKLKGKGVGENKWFWDLLMVEFLILAKSPGKHIMDN